jgi:RNA polymerase sigma-70 factor (ECF subfamily)
MTAYSTNTTAGGTISDEEVVERVLGGDKSLFEILMRRYNQRLYRVARSILGNDAEAEDVMQDAYVRAYIHLSQFDGRAKFSTWLTRIAVHESLARLRLRRRLVGIDSFTETDEVNMTFASDAPSPAQEALTETLRMVLEAAVNSLPEIYRSVFMLRDVEGMSTLETAESLDISEEVVKVRLHRARARLRKDIYSQTGAVTASAFEFMGTRCDNMVAVVMEKTKSL